MVWGLFQDIPVRIGEFKNAYEHYVVLGKES